MDRQPDLILRGRHGRRFTRRDNGHAFRPYVTVLLADMRDNYEHPELRVSWIHGTPDPERLTQDDATLTFQQSRVTPGDADSWKPVKGFLQAAHAHLRPLSQAYAMRLTARSETSWERQRARWSLDLLDAADQALSERAAERVDRGQSRYQDMRGCDLTRIIVGLRLLGCEIRIFNNRISERRATARARYSLERSAA